MCIAEGPHEYHHKEKIEVFFQHLKDYCNHYNGERKEDGIVKLDKIKLMLDTFR